MWLRSLALRINFPLYELLPVSLTAISVLEGPLKN